MSNSHNTRDTMAEWARAPPPSGPVWQRIAKVLYNPEDNSVLGRTPKRWVGGSGGALSVLQRSVATSRSGWWRRWVAEGGGGVEGCCSVLTGIVFTFYLVFYAVLAALFAVCMGGLFYNLDDKKPAYTLHQSLIGVNPGMSFRPRPLDGFELKPGVGNSTEVYLEELEAFLKPYTSVIPPGVETCTGADSFGFLVGKPCIFVKLNKIFDWVPEYYDASGLPDDMPEDLKEHIKGLDPTESKRVWVSCFEESHSNHTAGTTFEYPWGRSLFGTFPFRNQDNDVGPFLPVVVTPPENIAVNIRCRAWAKNVIYRKSIKEPSGYTRFRLSIAADEPTNTTTALN